MVASVWKGRFDRSTADRTVLLEGVTLIKLIELMDFMEEQGGVWEFRSRRPTGLVGLS